jgi:NADH dehydrogenase
VQANPLGKTLSEQSGAPLDRAGRIGVNPDLTLPGHPEVFVVGDMIALDNLPGVAQVAIQGAKYAAKEIRNRLEDKAPQPPFKYFDKGSMAIISRFRAVAMVGKLRLTGIVAWLMWLGVHLVYLTGFKNQVSALMRWAITFISNNRSERTTTEQQIFGRLALQRTDLVLRNSAEWSYGIDFADVDETWPNELEDERHNDELQHELAGAAAR